MKKKVIISTMILSIFLCLGIITFVNAEQVASPQVDAEILPDNGAIITSSQIINTKTGTEPFDEDNEFGNDQNEENDIVRSFDQVIWEIDNTFAVNETGAESYIGGKIYFEVDIPDVEDKGTIIWDLDSMGWIEDPVLSEDKTHLTGYYNLSQENITVPGKQTLLFVAKVLGAKNGTTLQPEFKMWLNGNTEENYKKVISKKITVSAKPQFNLKLKQSPDSHLLELEVDGKKLEGRLSRYNIIVQLYGDNALKGLKGIEFPKGEITFDVELKLERYEANTKTTEDITNEENVILYDYSSNGNRSI